jgi:O-antigen/teichoic acid export membrane protein
VLALYVTVRGGMVIPFIAYNPSLELFFAWQLGSSWMMLLLARAIYLRSLRFPVFASGTASFAALRPLLHFAGGMFALTILSALTMQIDKVIVSKLFPLDQFAIYSLASTISQLPYSLVAPLMLAMLPRLTEMISKGMDREASELYDRFVVLVAVVAGAGSAGLALFAPEVLQLWLQLDKVPDGAVALVRILSLGWLLFTLAATPFHLGMAYGHSRTSVVTGFASAAVAIPMLILLSRTVGLAGAAMPWVMINIASFLALNWNIHRRFYRGPARPGWVSLIAALGAGVVVGAARVLTSWLQLEPLAACAMAAGVIIGATLIFGAFYRKTLRAWFAPS